jgi:hypothetical protein
MLVLVSDTSVLVDLERGSLLDSCFSLRHEFVVPDLLYKRELAETGGAALIERGLRIEQLSKDELAVVQEIRAAHPRLSVVDAYAYSLAFSRAWTLLTGDGELRSVARTRELPFHGVLWVLDELFEAQVVEAKLLVAGLEAIASHPRCRLPRADIQARLARYRGEK